MSNGIPSTAQSFRQLSRRLFPMRGLAMAAAILLIIGTSGFLSIEYLKHNTEVMVEDSLAGLCDASLANASLVETFTKTLLLVTSASDGERERYRGEFESYNKQVNAAVSSYSGAIFAAEDRANFDHFLECRKIFLAVHQRIDQLMEARKYAEAQSLFKASLLPAYRDYKSAADKMMNYNARNGKVRGELILQICGFTQCLIVVAGIALFALGFFLGLFK